jgi:hypothetical protein
MESMLVRGVMKMTKTLTFSIVLVLAFSCIAHAGANQNFKVAVHVIPQSFPNCSTNMPAISDCGDIITTCENTGWIDVFPVFYGLNGVTSVEYNVTWPSAWFAATSGNCADLIIGSLTDTGQGVAQAYMSCQSSSVLVPAWISLNATTPGRVQIVEHPDPGVEAIRTGDCATPSPALDTAAESFAAGVGGLQGEDPCCGAESFARTFTENFTTLDYCDTTETTAEWDTSGVGSIGLSEFQMAFAGSCDTPGESDDVVVHGNYAYVADEFGGLQVIDITHPTSPIRGNSAPTSNAKGLDVAGDYAFVADYTAGIAVIDITDPENPSLVGGGSWDPLPSVTNRMKDLCVSGNYAYVADDAIGLIVVDITDPRALVLADTCQTTGGPEHVDVAGDYAYLADDAGGLKVIDISDPTATSIVATFPTTGAAKCVKVSGNYAYVACYSAGLEVVDITYPASPSAAGTFDPGSNAWGVTVSGDYCYLTNGTGLCAIDIRDPDNPQGVDCYTTPGTAWKVCLAGEYAFVADNTFGLHIVDIADPVLPPIPIAVCSEVGGARSLSVDGNIAYMTSDDVGLAAVDISNPRNPGFSNDWSCNTPGNARDVAIAGDVAYVADGYPDLVMVDITEPQNLTWEGGYDWETRYGGAHARGEANDIVVSGTYAYLADGKDGLRIFDISDPENPNKVKDVKTPSGYHHSYQGIVVEGDYAYIADGETGLQVVKVSPVADAKNVSGYNTPGFAYGLAVEGAIAYIADGLNGLVAIDTQDLENLELVGAYNTPGTAYHVAIDSVFAYIADGRSGLQVVNVAERDANLTGELLLDRYPVNAAVEGNYAYLACRDSGLVVANVSNPENPYYIARYRYGGNGDIRDIVHQDGYAYAADSLYGLHVMYVARADWPRMHGQCPAPGAVGVAVLDTISCVAMGPSGIQTVQVQDPVVPESLAVYDTPGHAWDVSMDTLYAYVADGSSGLQVIDISDPRNLSFVGSFDTQGDALGLDVDNGLACVADSDSLILISLATPSSPTYLGSYYTPGRACDVTIAGDFAMIADTDSGITVVDISDPSSPFFVESYDTDGRSLGIEEQDLYAYVSDYDGGLKVLSFTYAFVDSIRWNPHWHESAYANGRYVALTDNDLAIVADYKNWGGEGGVVTIDISDPYDLDVKVMRNTNGPTRHVVVDSNLAYVSDETVGFHIMEFEATGAIDTISTCSTPGDIKATAISGDYAFVADDRTGIWAADISDIERPTLVGALGSMGSSQTVVVDGNVAYVAGEGRSWHGCGAGEHSGMKAVDITDPSRPRIRDVWPRCDPIMGRPGGSDISGNILVTADQNPVNGNFYVIDATNPDSLYWHAVDTSPSSCRNVVLEGDLAYVADYHYGVTVFDISDLAYPVRLDRIGAGKWGECRHQPNCPNCPGGGNWYTVGDPVDLAIAGDYAFVADEIYGLWVLDVTVTDHADSVCPYAMPVPLTSPREIETHGDHAFIADNSVGLQVFSVFSRQFSLADTVVQSLPVATTGEDIARVALNTSPAYVDSIRWEISADGGTNWQAIATGHPGELVDSMGSELLWRSVHFGIKSGQNPSCDSISLDWWFTSAVIDSIVDIPADQGGWVRIYFSRSAYDFDVDSSPIVNYHVWRKTQDAVLAKGVLQSGTPVLGSAGPVLKAARTVPELTGDLELIEYNDRLYIASSSDSFPWESVGSVGATQSEYYEVAAPTFRDSLATCYMVSAHREDPTEWYLGPDYPGRSYDNQGMLAVKQLTLTAPGTICWNASLEEDLNYYSIYASPDSTRLSEVADMVDRTSDTTYVLPDSTEGYWVYVTATDRSGHESDPSNVVLNSGEAFLPHQYALSPNIPNPFKPTTVIHFALPERANVRLTVFDVRGREVKVLRSGSYEPGRYDAEWDATDSVGRSVSPGVYFYKLDANHFSQTRKMVLLR